VNTTSDKLLSLHVNSPTKLTYLNQDESGGVFHFKKKRALTMLICVLDESDFLGSNVILKTFK